MTDSSFVMARRTKIQKYDWKLNKKEAILNVGHGLDWSTCLAIDQDSNTLYLYDNIDTTLKIFNIDHPDSNSIEKITMQEQHYPYLLFMEGNLHKVGGRDNVKHQIHNVDKKTFEDHWYFKEWTNNKGIYWGGLIHIIIIFTSEYFSFLQNRPNFGGIRTKTHTPDFDQFS